MARLALAGDFDGARAIQRRYFALMQVNFVEANPAPAKWAMSRINLLEPVCRLPMVLPSEASRKKITDQVLESLKLAEGAAVKSRN